MPAPTMDTFATSGSDITPSAPIFSANCSVILILLLKSPKATVNAISL
jgi:hypothetical protein